MSPPLQNSTSFINHALKFQYPPLWGKGWHIVGDRLPSTTCCVWSVESSDQTLVAHQVSIFPEVRILGVQLELTLDVPWMFQHTAAVTSLLWMILTVWLLFDSPLHYLILRYMCWSWKVLLFVFNLDSAPYINMSSALHSGILPVIEPTLRWSYQVQTCQNFVRSVFAVWEWLPGFCTCCIMHGGTWIGYLVVV